MKPRATPRNGTEKRTDEDADLIQVPLLTLTLRYGIGRNGQRIFTEDAENHQDPGEGLPLMERLGMLAMAQQNSTFDTMLDALRKDDTGF